MNEKTLYFAYGSNLNLDQMARRCPDAEPVGRVRLDGYRLAFRRTGGGYLTILPDKGNHVDGLLWKVSAQDEPERPSRYYWNTVLEGCRQNGIPMQPMLEAWREAAQACRPQKHRDTFESPDR